MHQLQLNVWNGQSIGVPAHPGHASENIEFANRKLVCLFGWMQHNRIVIVTWVQMSVALGMLHCSQLSAFI